MQEAAPPPGTRADQGDRRAQLSGPCPNCGDPTESPFCPNCGQRRVHRRISLRRMLMEVLEDQFALNATLPRTLATLLFQPGKLSNEYIDGRIQRYIPPFRLYLACSIVFFLLLTFFARDVRVTAASDVEAARDSMQAALAELDSTERAALRGEGGRRGIFIELDDSVAPGSAAPADTGAAADTAASPYLWGQRMRINTGLAPVDTLVAHRLDQLRRMPGEQAAELVKREALQRLPTAVFLLLPVFALLLKLLYVRSKRYYVEHFVFGLHTHAFAFLMFTIMLLARGSNWVQVPAFTWMLVYFYLAMKRYYRQGAIKTFLKYIFLLQAYTVIMSFGTFLLLIAALLLS